jgi:hypothetical protein
MNKKVTMAFEAQSLLLHLNNILPVKQLPKTVKASKKYQQILASVREIGIIEPPVIARQQPNSNFYLLLDGHIRIEVLKDLGIEKVPCLVATDDEAFTYNKRINRLATIQEHKMILKAVERGVPESRIAKALNINITSIRKKQKLLDGICPEVANLLKDRHCPFNTFQSLKKMKPMRQVEATDLMIVMNNFTVAYSKALLAATPKDQLISPKKPKSFKGISPEKIEKMENEMANLQREIKLIEDTYGPDHLHLVLARGYITSILKNSKIVSYLKKNHDAIFFEFQKISKTTSMGADQ